MPKFPDPFRGIPHIIAIPVFILVGFVVCAAMFIGNIVYGHWLNGVQAQLFAHGIRVPGSVLTLVIVAAVASILRRVLQSVVRK